MWERTQVSVCGNQNLTPKPTEFWNETSIPFIWSYEVFLVGHFRAQKWFSIKTGNNGQILDFPFFMKILVYDWKPFWFGWFQKWKSWVSQLLNLWTCKLRFMAFSENLLNYSWIESKFEKPLISKNPIKKTKKLQLRLE